MTIIKPSLRKHPKHANALAWAIDEIGVTEHPMGSNLGQRVEFYQKFDWINGGGYAWCVCFFQAAWAVGAKEPLPYRTAGAWDYYRWAAEAGPKWYATQAQWRQVKPGDGVVFNVGSGHMAIVEYFEEVGSKVLVHSVDGNSSDQVKRATRELSLVRGFVTPPEVETRPPPVKQPNWTVVTSESGSKRILYSGKAMPSNQTIAKWVRKHNGVTIKRGKKKTKKQPPTAPMGEDKVT
jgi:CHAP domain